MGDIASHEVVVVAGKDDHLRHAFRDPREPVLRDVVRERGAHLRDVAHKLLRPGRCMAAPVDLYGMAEHE
jgi:hypothetical protein